MVTEGRWWGKAHVLLMRAQGVDRTWITQHAANAREAADDLDRTVSRAKVAELDACLEQLENSVATYRTQWVAYQYEVEKLRRDLATYERTLVDLPEVPEPPDATAQLLDDVHRAVETITEAAIERHRR
jgi:septal ring factor EnvC (AmiA/AmiB activator)